MNWIVQQNNSYWYCVQQDTRGKNINSFLCKDENEAARCAKSLNAIMEHRPLTLLEGADIFELLV